MLIAVVLLTVAVVVHAAGFTLALLRG